MRTKSFLIASLFSTLLALPAQLPAQVDISIKLGAQLGPELSVFAYSPARYGAWRTDYLHWTPTVIYEVRGHYYGHEVRGARAIVVYAYNGEYFFPPDSKGWIGLDKRYDYGRRPVAVDFARARPYPPAAAAAAAVRHAPDAGITVWAYTPERVGAWHQNYMKWTPVLVYAAHGRFFSNRVADGRPIEVYLYHNEYFMPPDAGAWVGLDRRFDYKHQPTGDDRARAQRHG